MKTIEKELQKVGDKQYYIQDDLKKIMESMNNTTDKIIEVLDRIEKKLEKIDAR